MVYVCGVVWHSLNSRTRRRHTNWATWRWQNDCGKLLLNTTPSSGLHLTQSKSPVSPLSSSLLTLLPKVTQQMYLILVAQLVIVYVVFLFELSICFFVIGFFYVCWLVFWVCVFNALSMAGRFFLPEASWSLLLPPRCCGLGAGSIPLRAIVNKKQCETRGLFMSLVIHYWIWDVQDSQGVSVSQNANYNFERHDIALLCWKCR